MYYSEKLANKHNDFPGECTSVLLIYEVDGTRLEANIKMNKEDISDVQARFSDMKLVFTMDAEANQKYIGTRCIGWYDNKRCPEVLVKKPGQANSCPRCWNAMRALLG